jgi:hypothetical protein
MGALALLVLVFIAPWIDSGGDSPEGWLLVLRLFAADATVRRVGIASSIGLAVTAFAFFRAPTRSRTDTGIH